MPQHPSQRPKDEDEAHLRQVLPKLHLEPPEAKKGGKGKRGKSESKPEREEAACYAVADQ